MLAPVITAQGKKPNARRLLRAFLTSDGRPPDPYVLRRSNGLRKP